MSVGVAAGSSVNDITGEASADLSALQYTFVYMDTSAQIASRATNAIVLGILQDKPSAAGQACRVRTIGGISLLVMSAAIDENKPIKPTTGGKGVLADTDKDHVGAISLEVAAADGDLIAVLVAIYDLAV